MKAKLTVIKTVCAVLCAVLAAAFLVVGIVGANDVPKDPDDYAYKGTFTFYRALCPVTYKTDDGKYQMTLYYTYAEWDELAKDEQVEGFVFADGSLDNIEVTDNKDELWSASDMELIGTYTFTRVLGEKDLDFDEDGELADNADCTECDNGKLRTCPVEFEAEGGEYTLIKNYTNEEWKNLPKEAVVEGEVYEVKESGAILTFDHAVTLDELVAAAKDAKAVGEEKTFQIALALALLAIGVGVMAFWGKHFTAYEQIWFISIMLLSALVSIFFPEEDMNGFSGILIMALYLADIFFNMLCELLISKQSKWNFIVSLFVEITEIVTCLVIASRFATMAVTLFFWIPIDIASFINWNLHPDRREEDITKVRKLSGWAAAAIIAGIVLWTALVGAFISQLDVATDLFGGNVMFKNIVAYLDACATAVGIANGLFIFFRFREQWIAWYICAAIESAINIMSGQFVLLVLKLGYFTNSTYGYIKWTKYIKEHKSEKTDRREFF